MNPEKEGSSSAISEFEGWPKVLGDVVSGVQLDPDRAASVMGEVLEGRFAPSQLGALLATLRARGETVGELAGFARAMYSAAVKVELPDELAARAINTCGTGGDRSNSINISTAATFVVAAAGVPVCKHGNRAASSRCGTADVLEALGANIDPGSRVVARCVQEVNVGFCLAPAFHPAVKHAIPIRRELGIPTAFNFMGPLTNPASLRRKMVGVGDPIAAEKMLEVLEALGFEHVMVVYGSDGLDELTTTAPSVVNELRNGEHFRYEIDAKDFGLGRATRDDLVGGDPAYNAARLRQILAGESHPQADIVALNAAAGLIVGGVVEGFDEGVELARSTLASGAASATLDAFVKATNS